VLTLDSGEIDVNVDPAPGKPFWVHTQNFRVQVLGTQFIVTPDRVSVREGHVQITDHQGNVLARDLAAGISFSLHQAAKPRASASHRPTGSSVAAKAQAAEAQGTTRDVSAILAQVRKAMGQNQTDTATQLLDSLRGAKMTRGEQAEGTTLRAEIALLEQNPARALAHYEELARRFRDLPAGENASFAAAQVAHRSAPAREKALLESYLTRYPKGRFADEVREKLGGL
jgi:ferric-dicitrate binding protein FerR (iron transport regulator)